jgi:hypothetical protein
MSHQVFGFVTSLRDNPNFPNVGPVFSIQCDTSEILAATQRSETVNGINSLTPQQPIPARLLQFCRGHWSIDNRLYWMRDVTSDEDRSRIRKGVGVQIMALLRNLAIAILRISGARYIAPTLRARSWMGINVSRLIGLPF